MFKKLTAVLVCSFICATVMAQQSVRFKIQYQPNHQYLIKTTTVMDMTMDVKGDSATMAQMKKSGLTMPLVMKSNRNMEANINTGVLSADKSAFPIQIVYSNVNARQSVNNQDMPLGASPLNGLTMTGQCVTDGKMVLDTMSNDPKLAAIKTIAAKTINTMLGALKFPDSPMKVGDTFEQDAAMPLPIPGISVAFNVKGIYKLISVDKGIANFDLTQTMTFSVNGQEQVPGMKMNGSGNGSGKLQYDIANSFTSSMQQNMTFSYVMPIETVTMSGNATMNINYQVAISKK